MTQFIDSFDARTVMKLCGFETVAMIDYLERTGVFLPAKSKTGRRGVPRRYTFRDIIVLKAIKTLLDNGASVKSLKLALSEFQKWKWKADPATLEDHNGPIRWMIARGTKIYFAKPDETLVSLTESGQFAFSFIIDLEPIHKQVCVNLGIHPQPELAFGI